MFFIRVCIDSDLLIVSCVPAGGGAERGEGEQRGSEGGSERADREAALPADPGGGAGESAQTGELLHSAFGAVQTQNNAHKAAQTPQNMVMSITFSQSQDDVWC